MCICDLLHILRLGAEADFTGAVHLGLHGDAATGIILVIVFAMGLHMAIVAATGIIVAIVFAMGLHLAIARPRGSSWQSSTRWESSWR